MNDKLINELIRVLFVESGESIFIFSDENWSIREFNESTSALLLYDRYEEKKPGLGDIIKNFSDSSSIVQFTKSSHQNIYLEDIIFINRYETEIIADLQIFRMNLDDFNLYLGIVIVDSFKKDSLRLRYEYISNISHEIRAPLAAINGMVELMQNKEGERVDLESKSLLESIRKNLIRMKTILDNLLRLDSSVRMPYIELFYPFESIIETIKLLELFAKEKGLLISSVIDKSIQLRGDKFEFSQIITNLLSNSIKYTNSGKIEIILSRISKDICCIDIIDTGIGIKKEYIPFIFNRFFRDPSLISKNVNGVGLGLWIVKELTTKMKGTIELESELGVGTKFKLKFPAPYL